MPVETTHARRAEQPPTTPRPRCESRVCARSEGLRIGAATVAGRLASCAVLLAALLIVPPVAADSAHFDTDYGPLFLEQRGERVSGLYPDYRGIVEGVLDARGEWLTGVWTQPDSERRCQRSLRGAWYWGTFDLRGITGERFEGFWAFCDDPRGSGGQWNGRHSGGDRLVKPAEAPRDNRIRMPAANQ